jgi:hypothetical protein
MRGDAYYPVRTELRPTTIRRAVACSGQALIWLLLLVLGSFIAFLHRVGFVDVLAVFGLAVPL